MSSSSDHEARTRKRRTPRFDEGPGPGGAGNEGAPERGVADSEAGSEIEQIYLDEISEIPLLDRESEVKVATRMAEARRALVEEILARPCHFVAGVEQLRSRGGTDTDRAAHEETVARLKRARAGYLAALVKNERKARPARAPLARARNALAASELRIVDLYPALSRFERAFRRLVARRRRASAEPGSDRSRVRLDLLRSLADTLMPYDDIVTHHRRLRELKERFEEAKSVLYVRNLRLVVYIAKRYRSRYMPFLDLVQEGNIGLMKAVDRFDVDRGFKFSTYATWWFRQAISRALAEKSRIIRIPVHMIENLTRVEKILKSRPEGKSPAVDGGAEGGRVDGIDMERLTQLLRNPISLDQKDEDGDSHALNRIIEASDSGAETEIRMDREVLRGKIRQSFRVLSHREKDVLRLRYGLEGEQALTLDEIGRRYSVSRERIRQIEIKALRKLRVPDRARALEPLLDSISA
jgi:RNA polymerase primary sigma factor